MLSTSDRPRSFSPCGVVLDRKSHLLMADPVRVFPDLAELCSPVREVLLVPLPGARAMADENEIVLYTNPMSRGRIAHWMLEEVGAPYRMVILDFEKREHKTPDFLELNPMGKVPT